MALHHKLCHVLGGAFNLPHAETHTIVLPHAVAYNAPAAPEAMERITQAMGSADAAQGLFELAGRLGTKQALRGNGMPEEGIEQAVKATLAAPYWNPRPLEEEALRNLLTRAWNGDPPQA
jgi:alcohol dehydrogenase class IV